MCCCAVLMACLTMPVSVAGQEKAVTNSLGMEFVLVPPGRMTVGRFQPPYPVPEDTVRGSKRPMVMWMGEGRGYNAEEFSLAKALALADALPGFEVTLARPYYVGRYEVTQGQWRTVMGDNPAVFRQGTAADADTRPVENVTWEVVQEFLRKLNALDPGKNYRLPTEFEWEYAARAGAEGDIAWADIWEMAHLGTGTTQAVGTKRPNAWGLYDMLGNVWEWVSDYYNEKIFADPQPPAVGKVHVLKGASFAGDVKNATWLTHAGGPGNGWDVGFRLVMDKPETRP